MLTDNCSYRVLADFDSKVKDFISRLNLFAGAQKIIVAVSGGADSVALLDWLTRNSPSPIEIIVAHLDHSLRGGESDSDSQFVHYLANSLNLRCFIKKADVKKYSEVKKLSLEEAGREVRYAFFQELRNDLSADAVAVAHHLDDQAETVLLRLLRGSGCSGLSAMKPRTLSGIVRPFLSVSREDIRSYLCVRALEWREDSSNTDTEISTRNRIRHNLLPLLSEYNPNISSRIAASAEILADEERVLEDIAASEYGSLMSRSGARITFESEPFRRLQPAIQRRLIRKVYSELNGSVARLSFLNINSAISLAKGSSSGLLTLPNGLLMQKSGGLVSISADQGISRLIPLVINGEGEYILSDGSRIYVELPCDKGSTVLPPCSNSSTVSAVIPLSENPFPWEIRSFLPGDRFRLKSMNGTKKLKKLFQEKRIPEWKRQSIPLFSSGGLIFFSASLDLPIIHHDLSGIGNAFIQVIQQEKCSE